MEEKRTDRGRRRILNWLLGSAASALAAAVLYPVARFMSTPARPEAQTNQMEAGPTNDPELLEKGFKIVSFGSEPVIVIRLGPEDYRAFSATCTHLQCIVEYRKDERDIWCNCHNGRYNLKGTPVSGPPPRPLTSYPVHLVGRTQPKTIVVSRA